MKRYTVKQLAELSGVSVRSLHFYDEIGLLEPASVGDNGYRYYGREQLLLLQQILFYRELGFPLEQIKSILGAPEFDKLKALRAHKAMLQKDASRLKELLLTIDKTIRNLERDTEMPDKDLYYGFDSEKQKAYEKELVDRYGQKAQKHIDESKRRTKHWGPADWKRVGGEGQAVNEGLVAQILKGAEPSAPAVQELVRLHHQWVSNFWTPNREAYIGLGRLYAEHQDFRKFYEAFHPKLADYLAEAMRVYAESRL